MKYIVKSEFIDQWFGNATTEEIEEAQANGFTTEDISRLACDWGVSVEELMEQVEELDEDEDNEEITLKISRINIKSETFCTPWNGKLYCVDICEDAEERTAWLYNSSYGVKSLMFGCKVEDMERDEFLDVVFSNLPDYIEDYADEYED